LFLLLVDCAFRYLRIFTKKGWLQVSDTQAASRLSVTVEGADIGIVLQALEFAMQQWEEKADEFWKEGKFERSQILKQAAMQANAVREKINNAVR
jgi:hypothetical protein